MERYEPGKNPSLFTKEFSRGEILKSTAIGTVRIPVNLPGLRVMTAGITRLTSGLENNVGLVTRRGMIRTIFQRSPQPPNTEELIRTHIGDKSDYEFNEGEACLKRSGVSVWAIVGYQRAVGSLKQVASDFEIPIEQVKAAMAYYQQNKRAVEGRLGWTSEANLLI